MSEINPGDRVKCIDDSFVDEDSNPFRAEDLVLPEAGEEYTVREVVSTS